MCAVGLTYMSIDPHCKLSSLNSSWIYRKGKEKEEITEKVEKVEKTESEEDKPVDIGMHILFVGGFFCCGGSCTAVYCWVRGAYVDTEGDGEDDDWSKAPALTPEYVYLRTNVNRRALLGGINSRISVISAQYVGLLSAHVEGVRPGKIERYTKSQPDLQLR